MTFASRQLDFTFQLGQGNFGESGANTVEVTGLRATADIEAMGLPSLGSAQLSVWGLPLTLMNQLTTLGTPLPVWQRNNRVTVKAGDDQTGMAVVFQGTIWQAWADFAGSPDVAFHIFSAPFLVEAQKPIAPFSYNGAVDVVTVVSGIATQAGFGFENNGVSGVMLSHPYLQGTARDQVERAAHAANIYCCIDASKQLISIWPKTGYRTGTAPTISADTGMVGYPTFSGSTVRVRCEFNRSLTFGGQMNIQSVNKPACGTWIINKLTHNLAALMLEDAPWFTDATGYRLGSPQQVAS